VIGVGIDAVPVVQFAKSLNWRVTIIDHRPSHIKPECFPLADRLLHILPENLADNLDLDQFNAMVLMTHNIEADERYLKGIANCRIPFIGLLGPVQRKDRLLQTLGVKANRIIDRVFGPVGLDIGAETPEEIAVSIMAGIYAAMNRRDGRQLNDKLKTVINGQAYESTHR
jgi:xanthine/CO dehydrogenase XdhC/CoxF family maturation factor